MFNTIYVLLLQRLTAEEENARARIAYICARSTKLGQSVTDFLLQRPLIGSEQCHCIKILKWRISYSQTALLWNGFSTMASHDRTCPCHTELMLAGYN